MLDVSMVFARAQETLAREIGAYLERNCRVRVDYGHQITRELGLLNAAGRALAADVMILLVSPEAVPYRLERDEWEPLFVDAATEHGTEVLFVAVADSPFPRVLLRSNTFRPEPDVLSCARELKRRIFDVKPPAERAFLVPDGAVAELSPERVESLFQELADGPGRREMADAAAVRAFAGHALRDFEGVFWVDCRGATVVEAAGEFGAQLGLSLAGDLPSNLTGIQRVTGEYRCLVILEGASEDVVDGLGDSGRSSVILLAGRERPGLTPALARGLLERVAGWLARREGVPPSGEIRQGMAWLLGGDDWTLACDLARSAVAWYRFQGRLAEAFEILEMAIAGAVERRDRAVAWEFGHDRAWILESWGRRPEAAGVFAAMEPPVEQLTLF